MRCRAGYGPIYTGRLDVRNQGYLTTASSNPKAGLKQSLSFCEAKTSVRSHLNKNWCVSEKVGGDDGYYITSSI